MKPYRLCVMHAGRPTPTEVALCDRATEVLETISELLSRHPDCDRIRVHAHDALLFQVDCRGTTVHD